MEAVKNLSIAVVGTGYWGKNLLRNFAEIGVLKAVCDTDAACAEQYIRHYNIKSLTWDQVLADSTIDAVVLAVPAKFHADMAYQALQAGKHTFVEKPLALDTNKAEELIKLAQEKKLTLMVGHLLQYHAAFIKLKDMVHKGELGQLNYIYSNRLNFGKFRRVEDILWSFAPHDISMILSLVGEEPLAVSAHGGYYLHESIADVTTTHLEFPGGVRAHVFVSWLHPIKEQKLVVVGSKAMAIFDDSKAWNEKLICYPHQINWSEGTPLPERKDGVAIPLEESEPLKSECLHFLESIVTGDNARTNGEEGLRVLKVLDIAAKDLKIKFSDKVKAQDYFLHKSSAVDVGAQIGMGTKIWHYSHILKGTVIGKNCVIGQNVMIGPDVRVGNNCKIQNNVSLYNGVILEDGVFCGPSCVFTNVNNPRAEVERKHEFRKTHVNKGVTIGANATIICGVTLGEYCFIGAGAVVTKDVPPYALVVGNPARQTGWVNENGDILRNRDNAEVSQKVTEAHIEVMGNEV